MLLDIVLLKRCDKMSIITLTHKEDNDLIVLNVSHIVAWYYESSIQCNVIDTINGSFSVKETLQEIEIRITYAKELL